MSAARHVLESNGIAVATEFCVWQHADGEGDDGSAGERRWRGGAQLAVRTVRKAMPALWQRPPPASPTPYDGPPYNLRRIDTHV